MTTPYSLTEDATHTILGDSTRRHVLSLLTQNGKQTIDELSHQITANERKSPPESVSEELRQRTTVSLVHKHLPLLEERGVVRYDRETKEVALEESFEGLEVDFNIENQHADRSIVQLLSAIY